MIVTGVESHAAASNRQNSVGPCYLCFPSVLNHHMDQVMQKKTKRAVLSNLVKCISHMDCIGLQSPRNWKLSCWYKNYWHFCTRFCTRFSPFFGSIFSHISDKHPTYIFHTIPGNFLPIFIPFLPPFFTPFLFIFYTILIPIFHTVLAPIFHTIPASIFHTIPIPILISSLPFFISSPYSSSNMCV